MPRKIDLYKTFESLSIDIEQEKIFSCIEEMILKILEHFLFKLQHMQTIKHKGTLSDMNNIHDYDWKLAFYLEIERKIAQNDESKGYLMPRESK